MLLQKATAMRALLESELADPAVTTRCRLSRLHGKSIHYGSTAVQILSFAPTVSQAINGTEDTAAIMIDRTPRDETPSQLLYDAELALSRRAACALRLPMYTLVDYMPRGVPRWPLVASPLYGAFMEGCLGNLEVLVIKRPWLGRLCPHLAAAAMPGQSQGEALQPALQGGAILELGAGFRAQILWSRTKGNKLSQCIKSVLKHILRYFRFFQ